MNVPVFSTNSVCSKSFFILSCRVVIVGDRAFYSEALCWFFEWIGASSTLQLHYKRNMIFTYGLFLSPTGFRFRVPESPVSSRIVCHCSGMTSRSTFSSEVRYIQPEFWRAVTRNSLYHTPPLNRIQCSLHVEVLLYKQ